VLDRLSNQSIPVRVMDGPAEPYRFHHAKYAVVDDRAIVLTENWKPAGTGGRSSRGWGVVLDAPAVRQGLVRAFEADTRARHTLGWDAYRHNESFEGVTPSETTYGTRFDPQTLTAQRAELLVAPDNAAGEVETLLDNASDSIRVVQVSIDGLNNRLLAASIDAARRGVDVDILLSQAWYTREDNRALAANLTALAEREDLPLSARLAEPNGRFEKIHAKGVVVDGEHVVLGSLNWNDNAFENNREVAVVLTGESVAAYYGKVFRADWRGGIWRLAVGLLLALALGLLLAVGVGRKIEFAGGVR
jgi:phosphatidylserine/phosphatidylglycerophosphate/cardiolipin synthase-like enzyme